MADSQFTITCCRLSNGDCKLQTKDKTSGSDTGGPLLSYICDGISIIG